MIEWLQKYSGLQTRGTNIEKIELNNLRKEMRHYKKKYEKDDEEMLVNSDDEEIKEKKEISPEEQKQIDEKIKKKRQKNKKCRQTISSEVYGEFNKPVMPLVREKTDEQKEKIKSICKKCFLFKINDNDLNKIIDSFKLENYTEGTKIEQIKNGDKIYLVESGELEYWKIFRKGDPPTFIKKYKEGNFIGISALLYNEKNENIIIAKNDCVLWSLDRESFRYILKDSNIEKRQKYIEILENIEILQNYENNELNQICDIIKEKKFFEGNEIVKQFDISDDFYILIDGKCHSEKIAEKDKEKDKEKVVATFIKDYQPNEYFLENALFKGEPNIASVIADTDCVLLTINRMALKRILGPIENILKRKYEVYVKFMKK